MLHRAAAATAAFPLAVIIGTTASGGSGDPPPRNYNSGDALKKTRDVAVTLVAMRDHPA